MDASGKARAAPAEDREIYRDFFTLILSHQENSLHREHSGLMGRQMNCP
jgi:hypothetical protein